jgi:hypothetical protein
MSTFGIDYQASLTYVMLGETSGGHHLANSIGDGYRDIIPNLVGPSAWGSAAASSKLGDKVFQNGAGKPGAWLENPGASLFWQGLNHRLGHFLGGVAPTLANGYECVVALSTDATVESRDALRRLSYDAGLVDTECIRSSEALLSEWLGGFISDSFSSRTVVTVVCSDSLTLVRAFKVALNQSHQPAITPSGIEIVIPAGHTAFVQRILNQVATRNREGLTARPLKEKLCIEEAVLAFASRLSRAEANMPVLWTGPFREQLFTNFRLSPEECRSWPEAIMIESQLPKAVHEVMGGIGTGESKPDAIIVGGIGSVWPCFGIALKGVKSTVSFRDPERAIALGAAIWPQMRGGFMSVSPSIKMLGEWAVSENSYHALPYSDAIAPKQVASILPPWER